MSFKWRQATRPGSCFLGDLFFTKCLDVFNLQPRKGWESAAVRCDFWHLLISRVWLRGEGVHRLESAFIIIRFNAVNVTARLFNCLQAAVIGFFFSPPLLQV